MRPARSLRLAQRVISGFIEAFDFAAVKRSSPTSKCAPKALGVRKSSTA